MGSIGIASAASASIHRMNKAAEERKHRAEHRRQQQREEASRRREEESRRREEESRRREEESRRRLIAGRDEKLAKVHHLEDTPKSVKIDPSVEFSKKCYYDKDELFGSVVSYDGYEYQCADGSTISDMGGYYTHKLTNGVTRVYLASPNGIKNKMFLMREDLPDGRARVYDTRYYSNDRKECKNFGEDEDIYFIAYERDADGSYRRYATTDEVEKCLYGWTTFKTQLVEEKGKEIQPVEFSKKCYCDKDELFGSVVSYDGYEYQCADGSTISDMGGYYTHKLTNGVTRVYLASPNGIKNKMFLMREDLPDGRARVYDTRYYSNDRKECKNFGEDEDIYFIAYERDADGSYRRYATTDEVEKYLYGQATFKTQLVEEKKSVQLSQTLVNAKKKARE